MGRLKFKTGFNSTLMVLVLLTQVTSYRCPIECNCGQEKGAIQAVCYFSSLNGKSFNFSVLMPQNITVLWIKCSERSGPPSTLRSQMFQGLQKLKKLIFSHCYFEYIHRDVFSGLDNLKDLSILIASKLPIHAETFLHVRNLETLRIVSSSLQELAPNILCTLNKINSLYLQKNKIDNISQVLNLCSRERSVFSALTNLNLEFNQIQILKSDFGQGPTNLQTLSLKGNKIRKIQNGALTNFSQLKYFDVSRNYLTQLPDDFLSGCSKVQNLMVSNNPITKLPSAIRELKNLQILIADNTLLTDINVLEKTSLVKLKVHNSSLKTIPPRLCRTNSDLKFLDLGQNSISNAPPNIFKNCIKLKWLDLSMNNISFLFNDSFKGLERLHTLSLNNNNISNCDEETFLNMPNLKELSLSSNSLTHIPPIPLILSDLDITYNKITDIHEDLYKLKSLHYFNAQHNLISKLQPNTIPGSVDTINLANNQIESIGYRTFAKMPNLRTVDLRRNKIVTLDLSSVKVGSNFTGRFAPRFYISGNRFRCDCKLSWLKRDRTKWFRFCDYPDFKDLEEVMCSKYKKHWLPDGMFHKIEANRFLCEYKRDHSQKLPFSCYHDCDCCLQKDCNCRDTCPENCLCTHTFYYDENLVNCTNGSLTDGTGVPSNATWIDLSANDLGNLSNKTFHRQTKTVALYLNHSKITRIGGRTFITFNLLKVLHLEYNEIRMLYTDSLLGLRSLKVLILSHNKIDIILPGTFSVIPGLEVLDLSHNNLQQIESQTFNLNNLKAIDLSGNPWSCKCEELKPLLDLIDTWSSKIDSKTLFCDKSLRPLTGQDFCRKKTFDLLIGMTLTLLVFIAGTIVYMYRDEIRILLFARFGWRIVRKKNLLDEGDKKYDAFVSFHNSQNNFVVNEMLPRLEDTDPAYKLCVHFRDFTAGAAIVDNITESIENSRRTVLLLTNQFLDSEWCRYEFQAAHLNALSNRLNSLILVLLEDVNPDLVYGGLKIFMKTKTYLRYDDPRFWDKLRLALPEIKKENSVS